jgi:hypothetical protein
MLCARSNAVLESFINRKTPRHANAYGGKNGSRYTYLVWNVTGNWPGRGLFALASLDLFIPSHHAYVHKIGGGERVKAKILEIKKAGQGFNVQSYSGIKTSFNYSTYQPIRVKLEVHPNSGAAYIAYDRFTISPKTFEVKPGADMQVAVSRVNPHWVASLPETARYNVEQPQRQGIFAGMTGMPAMSGMPGMSPASSIQASNDPKAELGKIKEMLDSGLITQQDYDKKKDEILTKMG